MGIFGCIKSKFVSFCFVVDGERCGAFSLKKLFDTTDNTHTEAMKVHNSVLIIGAERHYLLDIIFYVCFVVVLRFISNQYSFI
jgi:hypothetical protein